MAIYQGTTKLTSFSSGLSDVKPPENYTGDYLVVPTDQPQILSTKNKKLTSNLKVTADAQLLPENIKEGVELFGVTGTATSGFPPNGMSWTQSGDISFSCIEYGNGLFVGVDSGGSLEYSSNGINWYSTGIQLVSSYIQIFYDNGEWVVFDSGNALYYSNNGITWTKNDSIDWTNIPEIYYSQGVGISCYNNGGIVTFSKTSTDLIKGDSADVWAISPGMLYCNHIYIIGDSAFGGGSGLYYSIDGVIWTQSNITSGSFLSIDYKDGLYVASELNAVYYSSDGKTWTAIEEGPIESAISHNNEKWLAYDPQGQIWESINGKQWYICDDGIRITNILSKLLYNSNIWCLGTKMSPSWDWDSVTNYYSLTGSKWIATGESFDTIAYGKNLWVASNENGTYYSLTYGEVPPDELFLSTSLTFKGNEDFTLKTYNTTANWDGTLYYSTNGNEWSVWDGTEISSSNKNLFLRGTGNSVITGSSSSYRWVFSGTDNLKIEAIGRIDQLLDWKTVLTGGEPEMGDYCYYGMFYNCTSLTVAPELPATTLADYCYSYMFYNCTSLTTAPELPATTLANYCYNYMFCGCTSLTVAPELPATTLADYCYQYMFCACTSLTVAPELPATTLADYCYYSMFYNCTSLTTAPELPATTLANYCYGYMFCGCTSLTVAPELPATTLADYCYQFMFYNCTSLTVAPELPATTLADYCYNYMFYGCTSLTTAPELPATILADYCYYSMFCGCTSLTVAPELPATTLANGCYYYMFYGCTSLTTAPELPATTLAIYCYSYMFRACTSLTVAPELPATTLANGCYRNMFYGCTALNIYSTATGNATYLWVNTSDNTNYKVTNMFQNCNLDGSTFPNNGTPTEGTTYYWDTGETSGGGTQLINFSIAEDRHNETFTTYQAEDGMTWYDWLKSDYNTTNLLLDEEYNRVTDRKGYILWDGSEEIALDDIIIENMSYEISGGIGN